MTSLSPQHVCICDECSPVPYADRCKYEAQVEELVRERDRLQSATDRVVGEGINVTTAAKDVGALLEQALVERDAALQLAEDKQTAFNMMMDSRVEVSTGELVQARAAVKKLRQVVRQTQHEKGHHKRKSCNCDGCTVLADTNRPEYQ